MLDQSQRTAILELRKRGQGSRRIARALGLSRKAVRAVLESGSAEVPPIERAEKAEPWRQDILELYGGCKGNLVRVHEELVARGAALSYQGLTAFCRRHGIGHEPPRPEGRYDLPPGKEQQHDTSPHEARIVGRLRPAQTASLVLCFSRMTFIQLYPSFTRFECKLFLTDAVEYFDGSCADTMIDNTSVVRLRGTGAQMVPVPEMAAFAERLGTRFIAHEVGDANRSARVEGPFDHVDNNFLAGRDFRDWEHLNAEARAWCDRLNARYSAKLHASRRELFAAERPHLRPLPAWVPPVYSLHQRIVDAEGYVSVRRNRYSAPYQLIGRMLEVRECKDHVELYDGPRMLARHRRVLEPCDTRVTLPEHRPPRGERRPDAPPPELAEILALEPRLEPYAAELKRRSPGRGTLALRRLRRMLRDYPRAPFVDAVERARHFGLFDLERLERMVLRQIAHAYFVLPCDASGAGADAGAGATPGPDPEDDDHDR